MPKTAVAQSIPESLPDIPKAVLSLSLSRPARRVLDMMERAIDLYTRVNKPLPVIRLFKRDFRDLDTSLRAKTQGGVGLATHGFHGRRVVCHEE